MVFEKCSHRSFHGFSSSKIKITMAMYADEYISFSLDVCPRGVFVKTSPCSWTAYKKKPLFSIGISIAYDEKKTLYLRSIENTVSGTPQVGFTYLGPFKTQINGSPVFYSVVKSNVNNATFSHCRLCVQKHTYSIYVEFILEGIDFFIDNYASFLSSITINTEKNYKVWLTEHQDRKDMSTERDMNSLPYIRIPKGFVEVFENKSPLTRRIQNSDTSIIVADTSVLGLETDIDMFCERVETGIAENHTKLFPLRGKRCMVTNLSGQEMDFIHCQKVSIIVAYNEQCYSIIIDSEKIFNLVTYKPFINSIGAV